MKLNWGNSILIFFILFLSLGFAFIIFSLRQNNDLVTDDYYEKGADYMTEINTDQRSAIFMDSIHISQDDNHVIIAFSHDLTKQCEKFHIYFFRPSDKRLDYRMDFPSEALLRVKKTNLVHGRYSLQISWEKDSKSYLIEKDLMVK